MKKNNRTAAIAALVFGALAGLSTVLGCNEHPVTYPDRSLDYEVIFEPSTRTAPKMDILWMIDNSGSMCQEQKMLRQNFHRFVDILHETDINFHIGVTTTHMVTPEVFPVEPVALPGHLQSTPQPVPGYDPSCYYELDDDGFPLSELGMQPVIDSIALAVSCTYDPRQWQHLLSPNLDELHCALDRERWACDDILHRDREDFFPPVDAYRPIPKVLRAEDYRTETGALDLERLQGDFACMSMVGTRGYGFEKGLLSVVTALSPELTGPGGPNEGFLRPDARTGIIFVSDENDCSHDGSLEERSTCGVAECTFAENEGVSLIPVETLKNALMTNLSASKGTAVTEDDVIVASIHGSYQRHTEPRPLVCEEHFDLPVSCQTRMGQAYSGHRYDAFIRQFPTFFPRPPSRDVDAPLPGLICQSFGAALTGIARLFPITPAACIHNVYACDGPTAACPSEPYSGASGTCTAYPNDGDAFYCDTGLQVRLRASEPDPIGRLEATGYCIPESLGAPELAGGCAVAPVHYELSPCPGGPGLLFEWTHPLDPHLFEGLFVEIRYAIRH